MNEGWRCPGCGRCYAPFVSTCGWCGPFTSEPFQTPLPDALEKALKKMRETAEEGFDPRRLARLGQFGD